MNRHPTIRIHANAPPKPAPGAPCNGCGACCALEPCPVGMVLFLRRSGACPALEWHAGEHRYRCGLVADPSAHLAWLPRFAAPWLSRRALRFIAAGLGCDFDAELD